MNHVQDVAKDMAKVATGVGLVVAESARRLKFRDLGSFAFQTLKGFTYEASRIAGLNIKDRVDDFMRSEAEFQGLREVRGRRRTRNNSSLSRRSMDEFVIFQGLKNPGQQTTDQERSIRLQRDDPQSEELFAPKRAEASRELRPFTSLAASSLSQKVALPSVNFHLPQKKSRD